MSADRLLGSSVAMVLRTFGATEANLAKLWWLLRDIHSLAHEENRVEYTEQFDNLRKTYSDVLAALPSIDGWKPARIPSSPGLREGAKESTIQTTVDNTESSGRELLEYHYRFNKKRHQAVRTVVSDVVQEVDYLVSRLWDKHKDDSNVKAKVQDPDWDELKIRMREIDALLGSSYSRPQWGDFWRHMSFDEICNLGSIQKADWPTTKKRLYESLDSSDVLLGDSYPRPEWGNNWRYLPDAIPGHSAMRKTNWPVSGKWLHESQFNSNEPIPTQVNDLSELVSRQPQGRVEARLNWHALAAKDFERLLFCLISATPGYRKPDRVTRTNAPDHGPALSVLRTDYVPLAGMFDRRVIVQCRHWASKSITSKDVAEMVEQISHWEPRADVLVIATAGRFSSDAVALIEKQNDSSRLFKIEMLPESHLERVLYERPAVIAEFGLR